MTFSIVGFDPDTKELGVAVQSKFIAVGAVVPYAKAGVGAVATQSLASAEYAHKGLELMASGKSPQEILDMLVPSDEQSGLRQVGYVDARGNAATFTGDGCYSWAGGVTGPNYAAQGNVLVSEETVLAMARTFEQSAGPLGERLLKALNAGQEAGGDQRGMQSAALLVVKENGGYGGYTDRYLDLRVDDHPSPIQELIRIYHLHQLYFSGTKPEDLLIMTGDVRAEVASQLRRLGYLDTFDDSDDTTLFEALTRYIHTENFEEREQERGKIDRQVLEFMQSQQT